MQTENLPAAGHVMDVRLVPCSIKHGLIVKAWLELPVGSRLTLVNDHDPAPLRSQFAVQWPDAFAWQYLVSGPEEFRIQITKLKELGEPKVPIATSCNRD